jgi:AMMECR1 domain-containing protein
LSQLSCTVSFLHTFEKAAGWQDWEIGTHGLIIEFSDPHTREQRSATYLPEIAAAEGWTKQGTIDSLVRKAGYNGHVSHRLREALTITKYQSTAFMMTHTEYLAANTVPVDTMPAVGKAAAVAVQA